jgi:predicted metalloprotease with PDZ domain
MDTHFHFSTYLAHQNLISIEMAFRTTKKQDINLVLSSWRPGRYELAEYAMNIKHVHVVAGEKELKVIKSSRNVWSIQNCPAAEVTVSYLYFANVLNAGSCYIDEHLLYVNPINCCFHLEGQLDSRVKASMDVPKDFKANGMLPIKAGRMKAKSFDEWYDSPFLASSKIKRVKFDIEGVSTSVVFQGDVLDPPSSVEKIFKAFMKKQVKAFGSCPVTEYTYLVLCTPHRYYHGVEHELGTVLTLGPDKQVFTGSVFQDLLGVSSHEFYHTWNVKYMRPAEMWPYKFTEENYHRIGYIIEGITTYQGDVKLWQSGVFNDEQFLSEIKTHLDRNNANLGRHHLSVRESSFDLWVDGYKPSIPDRKVSIYTEGALIALIMESLVIQESKGKKNLDAVMKALYNHCQKRGRGYTEEDFMDILATFIGKKANSLFKYTLDQAGDLHKKVGKALSSMGVELKEDDSDIWASYYGLKFGTEAQPKVMNVHSSSEAYALGIRVGMTLIGVDNIWIESDLQNLLVNNRSKLHMKEGKVMKEFTLNKSKVSLYLQFQLTKKAGKEGALWKAWKT